MKLRGTFLALAAMAVLGLGLRAVSAASVTYVTSTPAAQADFVTSPGTVTLTLKDLVVNPNDVASNLSAFTFVLSGSPGAATVVESGAGIIVAGNGTTSAGAALPAGGWVLTQGGSTLRVDVLTGTGHAGPAYTIIGAPDGSGVYSNAGGSIAGNGPHNPFINQVGTFTFSMTGVTADTTVSSARFMFGTTENDGVGGIPQLTVGDVPPVPLPAAVWSGGALIVGLAAIRRFKRKSA